MCVLLLDAGLGGVWAVQPLLVTNLLRSDSPSL